MPVPARPITVTIAAAIEAVEGLVVIGAGGYVAWETIVGQPRDLPSAIALAVITVLAGVFLVLVARGLWHTRRWSRAPSVITQMFVLVVAVPMARGDERALGVPLAVVAVTGMVLLLMPETAQAMAADGDDEPAAPSRGDAPD